MTVAYMYNPFFGETFARVLGNIVISLDRNPRALTIAYLLPTMGKMIEATGRFKVTRRIRFGPAPSHQLVYYKSV
jgi:hypothetical protein